MVVVFKKFSLMPALNQSLPFADKDKLAALFSTHQAAGTKIPDSGFSLLSSLLVLQNFYPGEKPVTQSRSDAELSFCPVVREVPARRKGLVQAQQPAGEGGG